MPVSVNPNHDTPERGGDLLEEREHLRTYLEKFAHSASTSPFGLIDGFASTAAPSRPRRGTAIYADGK